MAGFFGTISLPAGLLSASSPKHHSGAEHGHLNNSNEHKKEMIKKIKKYILEITERSLCIIYG